VKWNPGCKVSVGVVAVLAVVGSAAAVGVSVAPVMASATPVNLVQNGSFETVAKQTTTFESVPAGNSTAISDWTVVTPALYSDSGRSSVDITSKRYFNAEDGKYSIDLAGSTGTPGGIYQSVATTPGVEYSLSFWSGVNGYQKPGKKHSMAVSVNGSSLDTVQAVSAGLPVNWVENTVTFIASSTTSQVEFADATPKDKQQGPTVDNVSLVAVPDVITASSVAIPDQTTGVSFTAPVATFTDSNPGAPTSDFQATIQWGDGGTSSGSISVSGSTYTVSGTYTYAAHGTYAPEVDISSVAGSTASATDSVTVADAVTSCTGDGCSGTVTTPTETVQINSSSTSGTVDTNVDPGDTGPDCGPNDQFRHAPEVTTYNAVGMDANIVFTVSFENASAAGSWFVPFEVCFQAQTPFTDYFGNTNVTTGLLPQCGNPVVAPCVQSIVESPDPQGNPTDAGTVVETIVVPPTDPPKFH
jgi:choice-of-anchor C domain-containing protein